MTIKFEWQQRVVDRMKELQITQRALASQLGVTQGTIGHWLNGRREPDITMFHKLAKALNIDPAFLAFGYTDNQKLDTIYSLLKNLNDDDLQLVISLLQSLNKK